MEYNYGAILEQFDLDELLQHLVFVLDWAPAPAECEQGSSIAIAGGYEFEYNENYGSFLVSRLFPDGSQHLIWRYYPHNLFTELVVDTIVEGYKFNFKSIIEPVSLLTAVVNRLNKLQTVLVEKTKEGNYISYENKI